MANTPASPSEPPLPKPATKKARAMISAALMRRKLFALAYLGEAKGNVTEAAKAAGFSHKTAYSLGSRLLKEPAVLELIERTRAEILAKAEAVAVIDKAYVLDTIHEAVERCMQRAPVMVRRGKEMVQLVDDEGRHVWRFDSAGVFKGAELLGRTLAMFTDKLEVKNTTVEDIIRDASEEPEALFV